MILLTYMFQAVLIGSIFDEYRRAHGRLVKQHTVHTVVALTAAFDWWVRLPSLRMRCMQAAPSPPPPPAPLSPTDSLLVFSL
jgi:hypothetical protein